MRVQRVLVPSSGSRVVDLSLARTMFRWSRLSVLVGDRASPNTTTACAHDLKGWFDILTGTEGGARHTRLGQLHDQVGTRRGTNIGKVAAARELVAPVFFGLRDGQIHRMNRPTTTAIGAGRRCRDPPRCDLAPTD